MSSAKKLFAKVCMLVAIMIALPMSALAQSMISGNVKEAIGEPIIGATVVEKGNAKNAAVTDFDGNFKIKVASGKKLVISYIGMVTQEVAANDGMVVTLEEDNTNLEDVVVIGYGSKARKDLTGSVGSVSGAKLAAVPVASAAEALTGKIAGVQVTSVDGQPGADINIRVRGATSVTQSNEPLYIVDGFQVSNINDIPPSDIASIDVLKDASLTAIYGAKGGNGVIVVTTKSAQSGKVKVSFNGRLTLSHITKQLDLMNSQNFAKYLYERAVAGGTDTRLYRLNFGHPQDVYENYHVATNDWQDEVMGNTPLSYQANVNIGGGNETTKFNLSLSQSEDKGIILGSGVRRTVVNLKLNTKLHKNLDFTYNPKMTYRRDEGAGGDAVGTGGIIDVLQYRPTAGVHSYGILNGVNSEGKVLPVESEETASSFILTNPVQDIATNVQKKHSYNISNQFSLKWTPIKGLILRSEGNYNISFRDTERFYGWATSTGKSNNNLPVAETSNRTSQSYTWTNTASYDMEIKEVHNLSFLLGQEIYNSWYKETSMTNRYFPKNITAEEAFNNMGLGSAKGAPTSKLSTSDRTASFFGQASYNYDHKYLFSATLRGDGSSKFAPGNQWGWFPSVSGAWVMNKEKFLKDVKWVDQLKLRVAFGLSGNNRISDDLWRYLYFTQSSGGPGFGEQSANGEKYYAAGSSLANQDIKWETTITRNLAADITLFGGRLNITPELYWNTTRDLLYSSTIASTSGYTKQMQNIGKVQNSGFDLTLSGDIVRGKDYVVSANLTLGHNKMKIKQLNATDDVLYNTAGKWKSNDEEDYKLEVGGELGLLYGYVYDGLYTFDDFQFDNTTAVGNTQQLVNGQLISGAIVNEALASSQAGASTLPGKIRLKDLNGDGKIDKNDKTVVGNTNPRWQGGFGFSGQYKDWDFAMNFSYMLDFDVYNATAFALSSNIGNGKTSYNNVLAKYSSSDTWTYVNTDPTSSGYLGGPYKSNTSSYTNNEGAVEYYKQMNANSSQWNPSDLTTKAIISNFVEDGSFVRCTDLTIGYTFPKKIVKKLYLSKLRAYFSAGNLFTITKYSGYDPEVDVQSGLTPSMDYNRYPRSRSFSFGVNVDF